MVTLFSGYGEMDVLWSNRYPTKYWRSYNFTTLLFNWTTLLNRNLLTFFFYFIKIFLLSSMLIFPLNVKINNELLSYYNNYKKNVYSYVYANLLIHFYDYQMIIYHQPNTYKPLLSHHTQTKKKSERID